MTEEEKKEYIAGYSDHMDLLKNESEETIATFKECVEEGCENDWPMALYAKGFGCYSGTSVYERDWDEAAKRLTRFVELTANPGAHNTLGLIFYSGKYLTGGPQYERAFQNFAIGHACGMTESTYKMAEMLQKGQGVPRNVRAAAKMVIQVYNDAFESFCNGEFDGKFPEAAFRMGELFEHGIGVKQDSKIAYSYYLQAQYAVERRMESKNRPGDDKMKEMIDGALTGMEISLPDDFWSKNMRIGVPGPILDLLSNSIGVDLTLQTIGGKYYLAAEGVGNGGSISGSTLMTVPPMGYCKLVHKTGVYIHNIETDLDEADLPKTVFITQISHNEEENIWEFKFRDKVELSFKCGGFLFYEKN